MAEFDPSVNTINQTMMDDKEKSMREVMVKMSHIKENCQPPTDPNEIAAQHVELLQARSLLAHKDTEMTELQSKLAAVETELEAKSRRKDELESQLLALEAEYEQLLEKNIQEEGQLAGGDFIHDLKAKLELQYNTKFDLQVAETQELKRENTKQLEENAKLKKIIAEYVEKNESLQVLYIDKLAFEAMKSDGAMGALDQETEMMRKQMALELIEFDAMKKKLMRDLQNRCEKVVELELSLDETREHYNTVLRNSNSRAQQKKMQSLERNLEQLTNVQKQLVDQNASLKKDIATNERKLAARNERIQSLERDVIEKQNEMLESEQK